MNPDASRVRRYEKALDLAQERVASWLEQDPTFCGTYTQSGKWQADPLVPSRGYVGGILAEFALLKSDPKWESALASYVPRMEADDARFLQDDPASIVLPLWWNRLRLQSDPEAKAALIQAGQGLAGRYVRRSGFFPSRHGNDVLAIEWLPNAALLFFAAHETLDQDLARFALRHCRTTKATLAREDGAIAQLVRFDPATGKPRATESPKGTPSDPCWSRGLAWAIAGFGLVYEVTSIREMRDAACHHADYWVQNIPPDRIPLWDFHAATAPDQPESLRHQKDSAAASIATSALLDLARHLQDDDTERAARYERCALETLDQLVLPEYLAAGDATWEGILRRAVYDAPRGLGVDESLIWGDYYFVESLSKALRRLRETSTGSPP